MGQICVVCGKDALVKQKGEKAYDVAMMLKDAKTLFLHKKCFFLLINTGKEMIKQWEKEKCQSNSKI